MSVAVEAERRVITTPDSSPVAIVPPRRPLVPLLLSFASGVLLDGMAPMPVSIWLTLLAAALAAAWTFQNRERVRRAHVCILASALLLGAGRHHVFFLVEDDDVGAFAGADSKLCRIRGEIVEGPARSSSRTPQDWDTAPRWNIVIRAGAICDQGEWKDASGRLMIHLKGPRPECRIGDAVEAIGWLIRPGPPLNDGEFDYPAFLRSKRILAVMHCSQPESVTTLRHASPLSVRRFLEDARERFSSTLHARLSNGSAKLADAILLGKRETLSRSELALFLESGTMHLLVVSGLHLLLVMWLLWQFGAAFAFGVRMRAAAVLTLIWAYAALTGGNPPVVRAATLSSFFLSSFLIGRPANPLNSVAAAGLALLAMDPSNLFKGGTQLSFLAVLGIALLYRPLASADDDPVEKVLPAWRRFPSQFGRKSLEALKFSAVIWLTVTPLILYRFHLLTPISIPLSAILMIPMTFALLSGFALLTMPQTPVGAVAAFVCDASLSLIQRAVESVESLSPGIPSASLYLPAIPHWLTIGIYATLLIPWMVVRSFSPDRRYAVAVLFWLSLGVGNACLPNRPAGLECSQLAVGHGNCAVVRWGNQALLYDCGSLRGPDVAERIIAPWLWGQGIRSIDAIVLSHSDVDHYNGVQGLARRFPIGAVFVSPHFIVDEPDVKILIEFLLKERIPLRFVWAGDKLRAGGDDGVDFEIVQPEAMSRHPTDNSASVVLRIRHRGVSLLMTGDLEKDGLNQIMASAADADIFLAPHHGSRMSNDDSVAQWAQAKAVISSQGFRPGSAEPLDVYSRRGAVVFRTDQDGSVRCRWLESSVEITGRNSGRRIVIDYP